MQPSLPAKRPVRRSSTSEGGSNPYLHKRRYGLLRGACHRARIRATRWLAMRAVTSTDDVTADFYSFDIGEGWRSSIYALAFESINRTELRSIKRANFL
jgi:hypothetical protein